MKPHKCEASRSCICNQSALEPNDYCPKHGFGHIPNKCKHCGRFFKLTPNLVHIGTVTTVKGVINEAN